MGRDNKWVYCIVSIMRIQSYLHLSLYLLHAEAESPHRGSNIYGTWTAVNAETVRSCPLIKYGRQFVNFPFRWWSIKRTDDSFIRRLG